MKAKKILCEFDFEKKSMGVILIDDKDEKYLMSKECRLYALFIGIAQLSEGLSFDGIDAISLKKLKENEKDTSSSADV